MHTLWKGTITFGLVSVPVKLHSATEERDITFKTIHRTCGTPLNQIRTCSTCQSTVESSDVVKGFEYESGKLVLLEKDELERVLPESSREIKVLHFLSREELNPIHYQKTYYLSPDTVGVNGYQLLMAAMNLTSKIAICKVSIRSKNSLAAIQVSGECLTLTTLYYPDEIRPAQGVPNLQSEPKVDKKGVELARMLITHMSKPFTASDYRNESRDHLLEFIEAKIAGKDVVVSPQATRTTVIDLMAALQASIDAIQPEKKKVKASKRTKSKQKLEISDSIETA